MTHRIIITELKDVATELERELFEKKSMELQYDVEEVDVE